MDRKKLLVPNDLHQLRSRLSDALENWNKTASDEFDGRTRDEIHAEIVRTSAALIHQARHGIWNAPALREALASWRLLKLVDEKACADRRGSRFAGDRGADFIWRKGERLFVGEVKIGPGSGKTHIAASIARHLLDSTDQSILVLDLFSLSASQAIHYKSLFAPPTMGGQHECNALFFGNYLSIRSEWRAITRVLDQLILEEAELNEVELLCRLAELIKQQLDQLGWVRVRYIVRTRTIGFAPTLYELVRSYVLITCLCPPVSAANAIAMRMGRLGFEETSDLHRRRAHQGANSRRMAVRRASRRRPRSAGRGTCARSCGNVGRYIVCGSADAPPHRKAKAPLLRRRRECLLDFLRVACP